MLARIEISEMGNGQIRFGIFNEYNQQIDHYLVKKEKKQKAIEKESEVFLSKGKSIYIKDMTIS